MFSHHYLTIHYNPSQLWRGGSQQGALKDLTSDLLMWSLSNRWFRLTADFSLRNWTSSHLVQ